MGGGKATRCHDEARETDHSIDFRTSLKQQLEIESIGRRALNAPALVEAPRLLVKGMHEQDARADCSDALSARVIASRRRNAPTPRPWTLTSTASRASSTAGIVCRG